MSKNNLFRAKINREAESGRDCKLVLHKNFVFFENRIYIQYFRKFKTWKHNRKQQFKNK